MRLIISLSFISAFALSGSAQPYDLKLKLTKGQHYTQSMTMDLNMVESISGQEIVINTRMLFEFKQVVHSITTKGDFVLECEYSRIGMNMDAMGEKMTYDSHVKDTTGNELIKAYGGTLSKIMEKKIFVTLSPKGKVVEIKGLKEAFESLENTANPAAQKLIESTFDEKKLTSNFESSYHIFPDKPVQIGDTWSQKSSMESMFPIDITTGYKLQEVKNGIARIAASGDFTMKKDDYETAGMKMKIDFSGTYTGTYDLDVSTGISTTSNVSMPMKGTMEVMGMELPVTVTTAIQTTTTATN